MTSKYKVIFREENAVDTGNHVKWEPGSHLEVIAVQISRNTETSETYLQIKAQNISEQIINAVSVEADLQYLDDSHEKFQISDLDADIKPGDTYIFKAEKLSRSDALRADVHVTSAKLSDGTVWESKGSEIDITTGETLELPHELFLERSSYLAKSGCKKVASATHKVNDQGEYWVCTCGQVNITESCIRCKVEKQVALDSENVELLESMAAEKKETAKLSEEERQTKKKKTKRIGIIAACIVAVVVVVAVIGVFAFQMSEDSKRVKFAGISFILPDGWSSKQTGNELEITAPENEDTVALMTGSFSALGNSTGTEEEYLETYLRSMLNGFDSNEFSGGIEKYDIKTLVIDGKTAVTTKSSFDIVGIPLEVQAFAIALDNGMVSLILGSTDGHYAEQFDRILNSVRVEPELDDSAKQAAEADLAKGRDALIGEWELKSLEAAHEVTSESDVRRLKNMGLKVTLNFGSNNTFTLDLFGETISGSWEVLSSKSGIMTTQNDTFNVEISDDEITIKEGIEYMSFTKVL